MTFNSDGWPVNLLLRRLILVHDFIFYFYTTLKKLLEKIKLSFEYFKNIMETGAFAPKEKRANAPVSIIFSNTWYFKVIIIE